MTVIQSFFLGILQGIAEFLPISSSGHLVLFKHFFGLSDVPILYDVLLHIATLLVVCIIFWKPIAAILAAAGRWILRKNKPEDAPHLSLTAALLVSTVFTAVLGVGIAYFKLDEFLNNHPKIVCLLMVVTGILLLLSKFAKEKKDFTKVKLLPSIGIGIAQGLGVFQGISRSGITVTACLYTGMPKNLSGVYAFLVSIPAILGAALLKLKDADQMLEQISLPLLACSFFTAMAVGFFALLLLKRIIDKGAFFWFSFYLIPAGIAGFLFI